MSLTVPVPVLARRPSPTTRSLLAEKRDALRRRAAVVCCLLPVPRNLNRGGSTTHVQDSRVVDGQEQQ